ncbi:MAG: hypothetical protein JJ938_05945 [Roseicyclus sp.]|nr:hypothetical protein [Roseicyclus sp.]MBO6624403.1 hypothetical protein [Roseicyclus sp.]MBO6922627.1 hypothetical protein [Roseicyclus sp.]
MTKAHWHYTRTDFLDTVFTMLVSGPVQAISLFGPRRIGKTQFLQYDLAPRAEMYGHQVAYASFWQMPTSPLAILLYELDQALRAEPIAKRLARGTLALSPKLRLRDPTRRGEIEIDLSDLKGKAPEDHLLLLDQYCEKLADETRPAILLFDEFQEILYAPEATAIMAALRTALDKRKTGLSVVFTGSSQSGLKRVFSQRDAPFFNFATEITLPPLPNDFVTQQLRAFHDTYRGTVATDTALAVFHDFDRNPLMFQIWLNALPLNGFDDAAARRQVAQQMAETGGYDRMWLELAPAQRAMLRLLAEEIAQPTGQTGHDFLQNLTGESLTASQRQKAQKALAQRHLIDNWDGRWQLTDPLLKAWVIARPEREFT